MTCEEARSLLDAYIDRELDLTSDRLVTQHLDECEGCRREADSIRELKTALLRGEQGLRAPEALQRRIEQAIRGWRPANEGASTAGRLRWFRSPSSIAIPAAIAALLVLVLMPTMFRRSDSDFLPREVVAAHVRSTQVDHLTDVASSDRHTVKPWFAGKIDFSPPVTDFQAQGFKLVGGRIDYLDDRAVVALVYQHGPHLINVFVWPATESDTTPALTTRSGYNLDHFAHAGMQYWIVSDTSADEIRKLAALLRS
jgi:anti-sigma factor RsiW